MEHILKLIFFFFIERLRILWCVFGGYKCREWKWLALKNFCRKRHWFYGWGTLHNTQCFKEMKINLHMLFYPFKSSFFQLHEYRLVLFIFIWRFWYVIFWGYGFFSFIKIVLFRLQKCIRIQILFYLSFILSCNNTFFSNPFCQRLQIRHNVSTCKLYQDKQSFYLEKQALLLVLPISCVEEWI